MWKMKRFDHITWTILLIAIYCVNESCADSKRNAFNPNDAKEIKLEVTENDGRVVVKEVKGEEMACVMKCFPVKEKKCRTKTTPEEETTFNTTPMPLETNETEEMTTGSRTSTVSFRSATSLAKKEQAVSAETTTEVSNSQEEKAEENAFNQLTTITTLIVTTNRAPTTGSITNQPKSSKFETPNVKTIKDHNIVPASLDLNSLDLVTPLEINNHRLYQSRPPKRKSILNSTTPFSERRHRKKLLQNFHSTTHNPIYTKNDHSSTTLKPLELTSLQLTENAPDTDVDPYTAPKNHNFRRHSHEDYEIDCDTTINDSVETFLSTEYPTHLIQINNEIIDTTTDSSDVSNMLLKSNSDILTTTTKSFEASAGQASTISESMRRMSESEEIYTECDTVEEIDRVVASTIKPVDIKAKIIPEYKYTTSTTLPSNIIPTTNKNVDLSTILNTESMRRMSESEEIATECDEDKTFTTNSQPMTEHPSINILSTTPTTQTDLPVVVESVTTSQVKSSTINELSRRMSDSDEDCESDENGSDNEYNMSSKGIASVTDPKLLTTSATILQFNKNSIAKTLPVSPITDSMRRMSESDENSADCDSHEHFIVLTTTEPNFSESMRRMSHIDILTTDAINPTHPTTINPTTISEDLIEFVTECDTDVPIMAEVESSPKLNENSTESKISESNSLSCCPDAVCSLLYPNLTICDVRRINTVVDDITNFIDKMDELRDMFYLYKTQVLITKMLADSDYIEKRVNYEHYLVRLWNETFLTHDIINTDSCTNSSSKQNAIEIISSIYCFLDHTDNLLNDSFLNMILDIVKRIETDFPNKKVIKYPKLRRIILQSLPKVSDESDEVNLLSDYMQRNRNYEKERIFLLQLLLDIQERFEMEMINYVTDIEENSDNQINTETTDLPESLQENGLAIKMHRNRK